LTLVWILGVPWAVNPVLAALAAIVFYFLGKEIYGEAEGRLAAVRFDLRVYDVCPERGY
jgi:asparagine N-glycosylation enzyme membrane subunit Stt3